MSSISASRAKSALAKVRPLMTAGVLGQVVGLLSVPLITRIYSEAEFGSLALMSSVLAIITPISALRFEMAVPLPAADRDATDVLGLALTTVCAMSSAAFVVALSGVLAFSDMGVGRSLVWSVAMAVNLLLSGLYLVAGTWLIRREAFRTIALVGAVQAVVQAVAYVLIGLLVPTSIGLFAALTLGNVVGVAAAYRGVRRAPRPPEIELDRDRMVGMSRRFRRFAVVSSPASLLNTVAVEMPFLVLARVASKATFGVLSVARRLTQAPISLLAQAVGQVFFGASARSHRSRERVVARQLTLLVVAMTAVSAVALAMYLFVVPPILSAVFDEGWDQTGKYVRLLSFVFLAQGVASATSTVVDVAQRQELQMLRDGTRLVTTAIAAVLVVQLTDSTTTAVIGFGIVGVANALLAVGISFVAARSLDASIHPDADADGHEPPADVVASAPAARAASSPAAAAAVTSSAQVSGHRGAPSVREGRLYARPMPVSHVPSDPDPTRAAIARAARWWWLGAGIAVLVAVAYTVAASSSSSDSGTATTTIWADRPAALSAETLLVEATDQVKASKSLTSRVVLEMKNDHVEVTITGSAASVQRDYAAVVELYGTVFGDLLREKMAPYIARAEAQLNAAIARAAEVTDVFDKLPEGSSAVQQLYLARYLALQDNVLTQQSYLADLRAQLERSDYLRLYPLAKDGKVTDTSGGGVFAVAVGLLFGALVGGAAMLTLGALDRKVRRTADLAGADVGDAAVVASRPATRATDGLLLSGATAAASTVVAVSAAATVPDDLLVPLRARVGEVPVIAVDDLAGAADQLAAATVVLVVDAGRSSTADVERWVAVLRTCSDGLAAVVVQSRR